MAINSFVKTFRRSSRIPFVPIWTEGFENRRDSVGIVRSIGDDGNLISVEHPGGLVAPYHSSEVSVPKTASEGVVWQMQFVDTSE